MSMTSEVKPRSDTSFIYSVSDQSKETLIGDSPTAMVYGFQHCKYTQIQDGLKGVLERVYDCSLGNDLVPGDSDHHRRLSGKKFIKFTQVFKNLIQVMKDALKHKTATGNVNQA